MGAKQFPRQSSPKTGVLLMFVLVLSALAPGWTSGQGVKRHFRGGSDPAMNAQERESFYACNLTFCNHDPETPYMFAFRTLQDHFKTAAYPQEGDSQIDVHWWEIVDYAQLTKGSVEAFLKRGDVEYELEKVIAARKGFIMTFLHEDDRISMVFPIVVYESHPYSYPTRPFINGEVYYLSTEEIAALEMDPQSQARLVQTCLKRAGKYDGMIDGVLGAKTIQAIREIQNKNRLEPTGRLDVDTIICIANCR